MKFRFNKKYLQIMGYAILAVVISGVLLMAAKEMPDLTQLTAKGFSAAKPVIWGLVIAYLLNPAVSFFRFRVFKKYTDSAKTVKKRNLIKNISVFIVIILALGLIVGLLFLIIPQLVTSVKGVIEKFDDYVNNFIGWLNRVFGDEPELLKLAQNSLAQLEEYVNSSWADISKSLVDFGTTVGSGLLSFLLGFKDFILGFFIAVYLLIYKDLLKAQVKKLIFAFFRNNTAQNILNVTRRTHDIFIHYFSGVLIDAFLIACITFIGASLIGTPYPILMATIIGCTNIIPVFGPFLGAIPTCFLILMVDPIKALWFAIFLLAMQQLDGNIIVPLIQGDTTGLPPLWVLIAITVGGGLFGFMGMLIGVPVFAVIYMLFKEFLDSKLMRKSLPLDGVLYNRDDIDKYTDGYKYTDEQKQTDEVWLESLNEPKKESNFFRRAADITKASKTTKK